MAEKLEDTSCESVVIMGTSPEFERGYTKMQVNHFKLNHPILGALKKVYYKLTRQI